MDEIERSIECGECRKPVHVIYTTINQRSMQRVSMCEECPLLKKNLYGQEEASINAKEPASEGTSLCCGNCGLNKEEVKMGARLGCPLCYEIFEDDIFHELVGSGRLSSKMKELKKSVPLHIGKTPASQSTFDPSIKLVSLQKELQETIKREDYEQAAWIRDKIQALTKKQRDGSDGETGKTFPFEKS